jgi:3-hydroxyacyl-[acyl-carrier-protein] dehydratase
MFLNQLYSIISFDSQENVAQFSIALDASHAIFAGHFPGMPILPGVVQLQIVKELLQTQFTTLVFVKEMKTCKFLKVINPKEVTPLQVEIKWSKSEHVIEVVVLMKDAENTYLKAQIAYSTTSPILS